MHSLRELYTIGRGPSSSHTMGPHKAAQLFAERNTRAASFRVTLFGSLAATGKGHLTDCAVADALKPKAAVFIWKPEQQLSQHPNGMLFEALDEVGQVTSSWQVYSVGGGVLEEHGRKVKSKKVYKQKNMDALIRWCEKNGRLLWELVIENEGDDIRAYLERVWSVMQQSIEAGLAEEGLLPGEIKLERKARDFFLKAQRNAPLFQRTGLLSAYALAVGEMNASGGEIVTAPTCGSSGVLPAVLKYTQDLLGLSDKEVIHALANAGLFGTVVKRNASISGALVGCQGEVGTACAMAAAAAVHLLGGSLRQAEYAAEMGMEHHLGLTCDPVAGLVQIPCIERNAIAANRALICAEYALLTDGRHHVSFDEVVETMRQTGIDMNANYKETSLGGLATHTHYSVKNKK